MIQQVQCGSKSLEDTMSSRRHGFTFVEILIAMLVFGILSAIAVPRFRMLKEKAYLATMRADLGELRIAEESYWAENHLYSTDATLLDWRPTSSVTILISTSNANTGFQATASHSLLSGMECRTLVGDEAVGVPSGEISCGAASANPPSGTGVQTATP
jgi:prepilin-type N-terminal cleavage/methylation domain-containing protein